VWAKTDAESGQSLSLVQHLSDAELVAGELWDYWLAPNVRRVISEGMPGGEDDGRILVTWQAALHDIGKATPGFAVKAGKARGFSHLVERMAEHGLRMPQLPLVGLPPHCRLGHWLLVDWLTSRHGFSIGAADTFAAPVGAHHGTPPTPRELTALSGDLWTGRSLLPWAETQDELMAGFTRVTGAEERLTAWRDVELRLTAQVMVAAVVVVADWLASDEARFPYDLAAGDHRRRLARARLGDDLLTPWQPPALTDDLSSTFPERFPHLSVANDVQRAVFAAVRQMSSPGLLLLEAPMGSGKTEAAYLAAEVLAEKFGAGGVFVALPTMATTDAMFGRVMDWVGNLPGDDPQSMYLAHGRARLNERYRGLVEASRVRGVNANEGPASTDEEDVNAVVTSWLRGRRKGVLANMVVGTIDQVLFAALKTRHLALRHLALAGKVVIVDEVHAADVYMRQFLLRALEWFGAYGVPVILMSATLPPSQRCELMDAYRSGSLLASQAGERLGSAADAAPGSTMALPPYLRRAKAAAPPVGLTSEADALAYPRVTVGSKQTVSHSVSWSGRTVSVQLETFSDELAALVTAVIGLVEQGACVLIVRNTVARAQQVYEALAATLDADRLMLAHSRFPASERALRESRLTDLLGPPRVGRHRPSGFVVIGTQVLEQSLDIDADVLFTDLAPLDLVLQRIGRLHRHERGHGERERPAEVQDARVFVTGVSDWESDPPEPVAGSVAVYSQAPLLRAAAVLQPHLNSQRQLQLPGDIPGLVQRAYDPCLVAPQPWQEALKEADAVAAHALAESRKAASAFRLGRATAPTMIGWLEGREREDRKDRPHVRDTEDSLEVILVWQDDDGTVRLLPGQAARHGDPLGLPDHPPERELAFAAAASTVRLPAAMTRGRAFDTVIGELETRPPHFTGWQQSPWLKGQLVLCLGPDLSAVINGWTLSYHPETGLTAIPPSRGDHP
jgi:CRISPR-associated endonuclease/helicase Cas3